MRTLGVIPARGGSKGVPRKNIRLLAGKPLLVWTAETALQAPSLARVVLSTEDEEIAAVGRAAGLEVPFLRPPELATDTAPTLPVVRHAVDFYEQRGERFEAICLLQPTAPLRPVAWIEGCLRLLADSGADSVMTMLPVPAEHHPFWVYLQHPDGSLHLSTGEPAPVARRQDLPPAFHREGAVYAVRRDVLMEQNSLYGLSSRGFVVDPALSVNIDDLEDWEEAERKLSARR